MRRRSFLAVAAAPALAGCLEELGNERATDGSEDGDETSSQDGNFVVTVEHPSVVVTTVSKQSVEASDAVEVTELDEPASTRVSEAVEDGVVEIEDPEPELLEQLEDVDFVRDDGDVYELSYSLPEYVVSGEESDRSPEEVDEDEVVSMSDDVIRTLGTDNQQIVSMANSVVERDGTGFAGTGEYRTTSIGDELRDFLDETTYLGVPEAGSEDPTEVDVLVELHVTEDDPGAPYELSAEHVPLEELYDVSDVRGLDDLSAEAADVVEAAVDGEYRGDGLPDGFEDEVGDSYFLVDGEAHQPDVLEPDYDAAPVELSVEVVDGDRGDVHTPPSEEDLEGFRERYEEAHESEDEEEIQALREEVWSLYRPEDAATFELSVTNTSGDSVEIFSGAPAPFGVLRAEQASGDDRALVVWSEAYEESGHVYAGPMGLEVNSIGLNTEVEPGETLSETYEVAFPQGEYRVEETMSVSTEGLVSENEHTVPYTLIIDVEGKDDAS
ncbi:MAG: hypothetical protein ACLFMT_01050 [Halobacteriales archaeon]